jgi:hypothetical protein
MLWLYLSDHMLELLHKGWNGNALIDGRNREEERVDGSHLHVLEELLALAAVLHGAVVFLQQRGASQSVGQPVRQLVSQKERQREKQVRQREERRERERLADEMNR